nr:nuclear transport factor 2 family protein [uncultured Sphaerochaeta sp.]
MIKIILDLEERLTNAELDANASVLDDLLSDNFRGISIRGIRLDKTGFISSICDSGVRFTDLKIENLEMTEKENTVYVYGRSIFNLEMNDTKITGTAQFLDIWVFDYKQWKLQSSSITPEKK